MAIQDSISRVVRLPKGVLSLFLQVRFSPEGFVLEWRRISNQFKRSPHPL